MAIPEFRKSLRTPHVSDPVVLDGHSFVIRFLFLSREAHSHGTTISFELRTPSSELKSYRRDVASILVHHRPLTLTKVVLRGRAFKKSFRTYVHGKY